MNPKQLIVLGALIFAFTTIRQLYRWAKMGVFQRYDPENPPVKWERKDKNPAHYPYAMLLIIDGMESRGQMRLVEQHLNAIPGVWAEMDFQKKECIAHTRLHMQEEPLRKAVQNAGCMVLMIREIAQENANNFS